MDNKAVRVVCRPVLNREDIAATVTNTETVGLLVGDESCSAQHIRCRVEVMNSTVLLNVDFTGLTQQRRGSSCWRGGYGAHTNDKRRGDHCRCNDATYGLR